MNAAAVKAAAKAAKVIIDALKDPKKTISTVVTIVIIAIAIVFIPMMVVYGAGDYISSLLADSISLDDTPASDLMEIYIDEAMLNIESAIHSRALFEAEIRKKPVRENLVHLSPEYIYAYISIMGAVSSEDILSFMYTICPIDIDENSLTVSNTIISVNEIEAIYPGFKEAYESLTGIIIYDGDITMTYPDGGMDIPLFHQYDAAWGGIRYGDGTIYDSGCGPTSISMVMTYLTHQTITPADVVAFAGDRYWTDDGSSWGIFRAAASNWGVNCTNLGNDVYAAVNELKLGHPVIISVKPGIFTKTGHFMVLRGLTEDGKILINDPWDTDTKNVRYQSYSPTIIQGESKNYWSFY